MNCSELIPGRKYCELSEVNYVLIRKTPEPLEEYICKLLDPHLPLCANHMSILADTQGALQVNIVEMKWRVLTEWRMLNWVFLDAFQSFVAPFLVEFLLVASIHAHLWQIDISARLAPLFRCLSGKCKLKTFRLKPACAEGFLCVTPDRRLDTFTCEFLQLTFASGLRASTAKMLTLQDRTYSFNDNSHPLFHSNSSALRAFV